MILSCVLILAMILSCVLILAHGDPENLLPIISHYFINLSTIFNIVRYLYGSTHM